MTQHANVQAPSMTPAEGDCFRRHVVTIEPGLIYLEIGVYIGGTLCTAADLTRDKGTLLYGIDPLDPAVVEQWAERSRLTRHPLLELFSNLRRLGDNDTKRIRIFPVSSEVLLADAAFRSEVMGKVGFLLIDGEHLKGIYRDVQYLEFLPIGAVVAIHDYNPPKCPDVCYVVDRLIEEGFVEQIERVDKMVIARKKRDDVPIIERPEHLIRREMEKRGLVPPTA